MMKAFLVTYFLICILGLFTWSGFAFYMKEKADGVIAGVGGCILLTFFVLLMNT